MRRVGSFDIETFTDDDNKLHPFCIITLFNNQYTSFYGKSCMSDFIDHMLKKKNEIYYAHNLTFDGSFIIKELSNQKIDYTIFLIKNKIYYIKINNISIEFKCTYLLFPYSLSKTETILKCGKKLNFDHSLTSESKINDSSFKEAVLKYCKNDVLLVYNLIKSYDDSLNKIFPKWFNKNSISSVTLSLFNKIYNPYNIKTKISFKDDNELRKSYFGGRCEIFGNPIKGDYIYHFDFKGMYNQVMLEDYPIGSHKKCLSEKIDNIGFYYVTVFSDLEIPILPFRNDDGKLLFPNGVFSGLYWYEELNYFIKQGGIIKKIHYTYIFKKKKKVFENFSNEINTLRSLNHRNNFIFKLINNSLYGRLGMSPQNDKTIICKSNELDNILLNENVKKYSIINETIIISITKDIKDNEIVKSNVIYASIITSKARIKLHKGFISVIKEGGRLLYTDTDSIFASFKKNVDNCTHGEIFWDISKINTKLKDAVFALPKTYALLNYNNSTTIKMKGLNNPKISFTEFKKKFYNGESHKFNEKQLINKNLEFNEITILKLISFDKKYYNKRLFSDNLKYTSSIKIYNNESNTDSSQSII